MTNDDYTDDQAATDEEDVTVIDGTSDSDETMDIDKTLGQVGLQGDDDGPHELSSGDIINQADSDQE